MFNSYFEVTIVFIFKQNGMNIEQCCSNSQLKHNEVTLKPA